MSSSYESSSETDNETTISEIDFAGIIINKKYALIKELGNGAFSTVWLSYHIIQKKFYAIKIHFPTDEDFKAGNKELEFLKKISNPKFGGKYFNKVIEDFIYESDYGKHLCIVFNLYAGSVYDLLKGKYAQG